MKEYFNAWNYVFDGMPIPFWKLTTKLSDLKHAWEQASLTEIKETGIGNEYIERFCNFKQSINPNEELEKIKSSGIEVITSRDPQYPKSLVYLNNHISPFVLYYKGDLSFPNDFSVGVVGTRNMTGYGESITKIIVADLAAYNPVIISGMADGVDTTAHKAAMENKIKTIAVLGFGLNMIPWHKQSFAEAIIKNGALVSEYPPDSKAQKYYFPLRNRIISGLSKAVVVVEAGEKSGALITARYALDQGREIFAVPGNLGNEKSIGTNRLIRDHANILTSAEDIITHYKMPKVSRIHQNIFNDNQKKLLKILKKSPCSKEELMLTEGFSAGELNALLTEFELKNLINKNREGRFYLNF